MKKIPRLILRENQVLSKGAKKFMLGGCDTLNGGCLPAVYCYGDYTYNGGSLPDVYVYAKAVHTGDTSTCPMCSQVLNPAYYIFNDGWEGGSTGFELGMQKYCESMKGH